MTTERKNRTSWNKRGMEKWSAVKADIDLTGGNVADVFKVEGGPVRIVCMFMEISEAVENKACLMSWILDSDTGGSRIIADTVDIANAALGDFFVAELDGSAIIKCTTGTSPIHGYWYDSSATNGTIVPVGGIDIVLDAALASGKGTLWIYYKPLIFNACISSQ